MTIYRVCNIFWFFLNSPSELTFWIAYICPLMVSKFSSVPTVFHQFHLDCTSYVDLCFSLMSLRNSSAVEEEKEEWVTWLYHRCNQSMHLTEGVTVMSLSASLLQNKHAHESSMQNCIKQKVIVLIQMWCKFWSCIKAKLCNRSHSQLDLPVCKNVALSFHLQLLQFEPRGKCVGQGGQLVCFSAVCWCDAVCISLF